MNTPDCPRPGPVPEGTPNRKLAALTGLAEWHARWKRFLLQKTERPRKWDVAEAVYLSCVSVASARRKTEWPENEEQWL